ncbi:MAG: hypothetical protein H0V70_30490 [Ktedonobacteraceae bacterium]|nr:hypothetical protein [Ktedonobacteraceae bacterium]
MPDTFKFKESYALLATNAKTFNGWLRKVGIDPDQQVNLVDPREKYITNEQLHLLAELHGRSLPDWVDQETEQQEPMTLDNLAERFAAYQQQVLQRFDQVDRVLLQMLLQLQEMMSKLQTQEPSLPQTVHFDQLKQSLLQISTSLQQMNGHSKSGQLLQQPEVLESVSVSAPVDERQESDHTAIAQAKPVQQKAPTKPKPSGGNKKKKPARGKKLPAGLILLRDFANQHGIVTERASAAGRSGKIHLTQGKWLVNSRWASEAIDAQGQHDFYEVFHEREDFTACPQCPHSLIS